MASDIDRFLIALRQQESGGNYTARNPSGASGAYQAMPGTWNNYGGYKEAYLAPPAVQDAWARQLAQSYFDRFGSWESVAKAWYAGPGFASKNQTAAQGSYPSIQSYANQVMARMGGTVTTAGAGGATVMAARPTDKAGILALQQQMKAAGFDPGPLDGIWGPRTQAAYDAYTASQARTGTATPQDPVAYARSTYGYLAAFLDDPEVGPILQQAAREGWDLARLQGALFATDWWKRSSASIRQWEALQAQDPAEATAKLEAAKAAIREQGRAMGTPLAPDRIDRIAMSAVQLGWSPQQIKSAILAEVDFAGAAPATAVGALKDRLSQIGESFGVWIPPEELTSWAQAITAGDQTEEAFKTTWAGVARAYYNNPGLTEALNSGLTTRQFASQVIGDASQLLGVNPDSVNLMDPKWQRFLFANPETGQAWTGPEQQKVMRLDPQYGYDLTPTAETAARSAAVGMLTRWGFA